MCHIILLCFDLSFLQSEIGRENAASLSPFREPKDLLQEEAIQLASDHCSKKKKKTQPTLFMGHTVKMKVQLSHYQSKGL